MANGLPAGTRDAGKRERGAQPVGDRDGFRGAGVAHRQRSEAQAGGRKRHRSAAVAGHVDRLRAGVIGDRQDSGSRAHDGRREDDGDGARCRGRELPLQVLVWLKGPVTATFVICSGPVPELCTVTLRAVLEVPMTCEEKESEVGVTVAAGAVPVPLSASVCEGPRL